MTKPRGGKAIKLSEGTENINNDGFWEELGARRKMSEVWAPVMTTVTGTDLFRGHPVEAKMKTIGSESKKGRTHKDNIEVPFTLDFEKSVEAKPKYKKYTLNHHKYKKPELRGGKKIYKHAFVPDGWNSIIK
jgi:hypothetical protein